MQQISYISSISLLSTLDMQSFQLLRFATPSECD